MMVILVFIAATLVCGVCVILVFHKSYEDGLFGRISLAVIGLMAAARVLEILEEGSKVDISPIGGLLWLGLALFFGRHLYRFMRWQKNGDNEWRKANQRETAGKNMAQSK